MSIRGEGEKTDEEKEKDDGWKGVSGRHFFIAWN